MAYESGTVSDRSGTLCYVIERLERVRQWWGMDGVYDREQWDRVRQFLVRQHVV